MLQNTTDERWIDICENIIGSKPYQQELHPGLPYPLTLLEIKITMK